VPPRTHERTDRPEESEPSTLATVRLARGCILVSPAEGSLRPLKTSESVARDVVHDIVRRRLVSGDALPNEATMLATYGVSRESLREGLRLLEVEGLLTIRRGPGGGPVVGQIDPSNLGRTSSLYYHVAGATYAELFDAWVLTERVQAELAAANPDRARVRAAMEPYLPQEERQEDTEDLAKFVVLHTQFHAVVASLMGNTVLELLLQTVGQIVTHHVVVNSDPRRVQEEIGRGHARIAKAISAGHMRRARDLMEEHIVTVAEVYTEQFGRRMDDYVEWQ
jgi:DNA-binding FadR family transcriptional regulator